MHLSTKFSSLYFFLLVCFSCWSSAAFAFLASEMRVVVVSPFIYAEDGVPQNVKEEMAIDVDLPRETAVYFESTNAFKSVALLEPDSNTQSEADLVVRGEILYVHGGSGAERYFGSLGGAGRASMLIGIKVFDGRGQLLHEGRVAQEGTKATNVWTAWSNKKNLESALRVLPQKILPIAIGGDLETSAGVIRALQSGSALALRAAAKSSHSHGLFKDHKVTDVMEGVVLEGIDDGDKDGTLIDGLAWCLINIGESLDPKYTPSLVKIIESDAPNKIKKHAKKALKNIEAGNR